MKGSKQVTAVTP